MIFECYLKITCPLLCKIQHSKKTTQNHGPLFVIPWQIKLCCYFQVHCAYMCKERENEKCLLRNLSSNEVREYMRNLSSWFYLNTTISLFSLIVLSKTNVLLPIQHPLCCMSKRTERGNGMWGWNCQWLQPYLLTLHALTIQRVSLLFVGGRDFNICKMRSRNSEKCLTLSYS